MCGTFHLFFLNSETSQIILFDNQQHAVNTALLICNEEYYLTQSKAD